MSGKLDCGFQKVLTAGGENGQGQRGRRESDGGKLRVWRWQKAPLLCAFLS
jgi:hypothetical protein